MILKKVLLKFKMAATDNFIIFVGVIICFQFYEHIPFDMEMCVQVMFSRFTEILNGRHNFCGRKNLKI